jgi:hypothetical protein
MLSAIAETHSVLRSSRYAHLSPKQIVPQLADEGGRDGGRSPDRI